MPRYRTCCGCMEVKTGAMVLGLIGFFVASFGLISDSIGLGVYAPKIDEMLDEVKMRSMNEFIAKGSPDDERLFYETQWKQIEVVKTIVPWVFIIQITCCAISFLINGSLIYGLNSKKANFMLPWLISHMAAIILNCTAFTIVFFVMATATPGGIGSAMILALICTPLLVLYFYFWFVVRSAYLELKEEKMTELNMDARVERAGGNYVKM